MSLKYCQVIGFKNQEVNTANFLEVINQIQATYPSEPIILRPNDPAEYNDKK